MCGEPRVAAECTCTEREFGRCSRPTVRPGRTVHDARDHGDGSSTRSRGRRTSGSLTETRVCDWQYLPERFDGSADRTMNPCSLDGTDQRARTVLAACIEPDGPVDADGDPGPGHRRCAPPGLPARWRGGTALGRGHRGARAPATPPPVLVAEARGPPLTGRGEMTRVGRGRSSDSGSHSRGRPHSPAWLDSGRAGHRR